MPFFAIWLTYCGILNWRKDGQKWISRFLIGASAVFTLLPVTAYYLWARHLSLSYPPFHFAGTGNWIWVNGLQAWLDEKYFLSKLFWNAESKTPSENIQFFSASGIISSRMLSKLFHLNYVGQELISQEMKRLP